MTLTSRMLSNWYHTLCAPMSWRVRARRMFVLTAPLSIPAWLLCLMAVGVARLAHRSAIPILSFWSAPPRRGRSDGYGSYLSGRR